MSSTPPYDKVPSQGKTIGLSTYTGYNFNERAMLSLAIVNNEFSEPGTQVTLVWGEEGGGTQKPTDKAHRRPPRTGGNQSHGRARADLRGCARGVSAQSAGLRENP